MERTIHPALTSNPLSFVSFTPFFASPELWENEGANGKLLNLGCQAARSFAAINAEGDVTPCVQLLDSDVSCGNVRERPLSDILENHPTFKALRIRSSYKGKCGRCRYKMTCGGCRALAFYRSGDLLAEDPTCFFEPDDETAVCACEEKETRQLMKFIDYIRYNEPWNLIF
jgi:radical SAM protein with 4Fe4S-binding SPASM domain